MHHHLSLVEIQRTQPLINHLATRRTEHFDWFYLLHTLSLVATGTVELISRTPTAGGETLLVRDSLSGEQWSVACPATLPPGIEAHVVTEYGRLVAGERLRGMDIGFFVYLFDAAYCTSCQHRGEWQICFECHYAGGSVNFLPFEPEAAPPLP